MNESRFTRTDSALAMACGVEINIRASADVVWSLFSDAKGFPRCEAERIAHELGDATPEAR